MFLIYRYIGLIFSFLSLFFQSVEKIEHKVELIHPGVSSEKRLEYTLTEIIDKQAKESIFYMDVQSVFCGSKVCKVVFVRVFWDNIGRYQRYELKEGVNLEKTKGAPFTEEDHMKLHKILQDQYSPLKDVYEEDIINDNQIQADSGDDVDSISGATMAIDENATVKGATWTCYTMWHWANGGIVSQIQNITIASLKTSKIVSYALQGKDKRKQAFAIKKLQERKAYSEETYNELLKIQTTINKDNIKYFIFYLEGAPFELYKSLIQKLIVSNNYDIVIECLYSLLRKSDVLSQSYVNAVVNQLVYFNDYKQVSLLVRLVEKSELISKHTTAEILKLLEYPNILIARRAYWHLEQVELNKSGKLKLKSFKKQHPNSL